MKSIKNFFAITFGVLGALIMAPFVAFFGLMMLGLAFGLSLIAAGAVTTMAKAAQDAEAEDTVEATAQAEDAQAADEAQAQPA